MTIWSPLQTAMYHSLSHGANHNPALGAVWVAVWRSELWSSPSGSLYILLASPRIVRRAVGYRVGSLHYRLPRESRAQAKSSISEHGGVRLVHGVYLPGVHHLPCDLMDPAARTFLQAERLCVRGVLPRRTGRDLHRKCLDAHDPVAFQPKANALVLGREMLHDERVAYDLYLCCVQFMQFKEQESNFYHVMEVPRDAGFSEIKRAFRTRSIDLHPDKNPSPTAVGDFNRLRLAFDVLGDAQKRALYDLFGESAVLKDLSAVQIESVIGAISFYAFWAVLTFVLTLSEAARDARAWSFAGGVLFFILEINLIFGGLQLPSKFFPYMTVFEFTKLIRAAFPPFVNGTRAIGGYYYRSFAQENFALGIELLNSNRAILLSMRQLQGEVASTRRRPGPSTAVKPDALPPGAKRRSKFDKHAPPPQAAVAAAAAHAEEEPAVSAAEQDLQNPSPEVQKPPSFNIPSFVYVIGFYLAVNYFFQ